MMQELDLVFQPISNEEAQKKYGAYAINPDLLQQRPNQHILVPLRSSQFHVEIANSIANITLTQTYFNPTEKFLEVEYNFPINPDACVYKFVAEFAKIKIEGVVKEKQQAQKQYRQAIKEGKKAAIGNLDPNSKDIFNLKVGNVPPKEIVTIQVVYLQELTLSCNTFYQLHMVGTISPRYMNYIPLENIKAGLRNEGAKVQGDFYWNFRITLKTSRKGIFFKSNSHEIQQIYQNDHKTAFQFVMTKSCIPNKDFFFTYTTEDFQLPSYVFGRTDASSTAMLSFIPKFCDLSIDDAYKASIEGKKFETEIDKVKGEYIFLLDRSGSMEGARIEKAKEALILFIKSLPLDTYFNIFSFGSRSEKMFESSVKYNDKEIKAVVNRVRELSANLGGTQIYNPLLQILTQETIKGYPKQIFLLTDGGVYNSQQVVNMVSANNKYSRVHTIGIGNGASEKIIIGCAKKGKGQHVFITDNENPSQKIIQLLTDSLSPVITNMKLTYDNNIVESIIPNPESLPYVLKGELVNFYITFKGQLPHSAYLSFSYEDSLNKLSFKSELVIDPNSANEPFIDRMGHFKRIRLLEQSQSANSNLQDKMFYVKVVDKKAEIIKQSVKHQILSVHTAFLCVEKQLIDGKYEEVRDKGQFKVLVQNSRPFEYNALEECSMWRSGSHDVTIGGYGGQERFRSLRATPHVSLDSQMLQLKKLSTSIGQQLQNQSSLIDSLSTNLQGSKAKNQGVAVFQVRAKKSPAMTQKNRQTRYLISLSPSFLSQYPASQLMAPGKS